MQVTVESLSGLERRMRVAIPEARVAGEVNGRLESMARTVRIPGFRPGKVPVKVVARRFGRQVRDEVVGEIVRSSFSDAVTQEQLRPAGLPTIDPLESEPGQGVSYTAVFDVFPEVAAPSIEALEIARPEAAVTDADVTRMLDTLRQQRRTWAVVERPAAQGDRVTIDFDGTVDGQRVERASAEGFVAEIGAQRLMDGFEQGLVGAGAGDARTLELHFPDDYGDAELSGKPVTFEVRVQKVEEGRVPELDAEFAKAFGVASGDMDAFRSEVRANMERELADSLRAMTRKHVMDALLAANPVELPPSLVEEEARRLHQQREQELTYRGVDAARVGLQPGMFEEDARRRVALGLLLAEIVKSSKLTADPKQVRERIESLASTYEQPQEVVAWYYADRSRLGDIESAVLEDAVVAWILERAQVHPEVTSFDALLNPGQTTEAGEEAPASS